MLISLSNYDEHVTGASPARVHRCAGHPGPKPGIAGPVPPLGRHVTCGVWESDGDSSGGKGLTANVCFSSPKPTNKEVIRVLGRHSWRWHLATDRLTGPFPAGRSDHRASEEHDLDSFPASSGVGQQRKF